MAFRTSFSVCTPEAFDNGKKPEIPAALCSRYHERRHRSQRPGHPEIGPPRSIARRYERRWRRLVVTRERHLVGGRLAFGVLEYKAPPGPCLKSAAPLRSLPLRPLFDP